MPGDKDEATRVVMQLLKALQLIRERGAEGATAAEIDVEALADTKLIPVVHGLETLGAVTRKEPSTPARFRITAVGIRLIEVLQLGFTADGIIARIKAGVSLLENDMVNPPEGLESPQLPAPPAPSSTTNGVDNLIAGGAPH